ncbi:MAG: YaaR family protein [Bacillota bacterium]
MRISPVDRRRDEISTRVKKTADKDFSSFMDMAGKENPEQRLKDMLGKIMKLSDKLKAVPTVRDIREYKKHIAEYLDFILKNYYKISKDYARFSSSLLTRVEVINKKVDNLVSQFLEDQKNNLELIRDVDEITGLLLDLYK